MVENIDWKDKKNDRRVREKGRVKSRTYRSDCAE